MSVPSASVSLVSPPSVPFDAVSAPLSARETAHRSVRLVPACAHPRASLGHSFVAAHGQSGSVVTVGNWIPGKLGPSTAVRIGQSRYDCYPSFHVPDPGADAYLGLLNVAALQPGEEAISPRLMPGLRRHFEDIGILAPDAKIYEVDFNVREQVVKDAGGRPVRKLAGFPHTDLLSQAAIQGVQLPRDAWVAAIFPSDEVREQLGRIGGTLIQPTDAAITNNKALFRVAAERYGFPVFPGTLIYNLEELFAQVDSLNAEFMASYRTVAGLYGAAVAGERLRHVARLKDPRSSGGDGVQEVLAPATRGSLQRAYAALRAGMVNALLLNDYGGGDLSRYWPQGDTGPLPYPLVLEHDASLIGECCFNGSFMVHIHHDGSYSMPHVFGQYTDANGSFRGGYSVEVSRTAAHEILSASVCEELHRHVEAIVRYWHGELGVCGIAGCDFMVLRRHDDGRAALYFFDPNVRPTINSISLMVFEKVRDVFGYGHWANINLWAPRAIESMRSLREVCSLAEADLFHGCDEGIVVPMALRSVWNGDACVRPSNVAKILIAAPSVDGVKRVMARLQDENGVRYSADEQ